MSIMCGSSDHSKGQLLRLASFAILHGVNRTLRDFAFFLSSLQYFFLITDPRRIHHNPAGDDNAPAILQKISPASVSGMFFLP